MSWFFETRTIPSQKNGAIVATRRFGGWQITVEGCEQTGPEVHTMWKNAFAKVRTHQGLQPIRKVLMLGLGGGGEIKNIYRSFPKAELTVIEYDEAMLALAENLKLYRPFPFPKVICEDAASALTRLTEHYDLIIVDIFKGPEPSLLVTNEKFLEGLRSRLSQNGFLLLNAYRHPEYLEAPRGFFSSLAEWRFAWNHLGLYMKDSEKARAFLPKDEWPKADPTASMPAFLQPGYIGTNPRGLYWRFWPATFELYRGDVEPAIMPLPEAMRAPFRVISWQRFRRGDAPKGWRAFTDKPYRKIGFAEVIEGYEKGWSENARRMRREWLSKYLGTTYRLEKVPFEEFKAAYLKSTVPYFLRGDVIAQIKRRIRRDEPVSLWAARRLSDGRLGAGIAVLHSKEAKSSYYIGGFYAKAAAHEPLMPGLFDYWFQDALARGDMCIDFGNFWKGGDPSSWKGFSLFKAKFAPQYFFYKPMLYRFGNPKR